MGVPVSSADLDPFRTISVMINASCNLKCLHCDLPRKYSRYDGVLSTGQWGELIDHLIPMIRPEVVSIAAMEPMMPKIGQPKTAAVLRSALRHGVTAGVVSNGTYVEEFFSSYGADIKLNFLDVSIEGVSELDDRIRGKGHFEMVNRLLHSKTVLAHTEKLYLSSTLTKLSAHPDMLSPFLDWVVRSLDEPRLVLLLLYPNQHVESGLALDDDDLNRILDLIIKRSNEFADIFLEAFPSSLPGLATLIEERTFPGEGEVKRDRGGMIWGHIAENLFIRYENKHDFSLYHLRISPEGYALPPECMESPNYLEGAYGKIIDDGWNTIRQKILSSVDALTLDMEYRGCRGRRCRAVCGGGNHRCYVRNEKQEDVI